jgi:outer membrane lipoprotein
MRFLVLCIVFAYFPLSGCAGDTCRPAGGYSSVTASMVSDTGSHVGKLVQWGGTLVETRHLKDSTDLEVIAYPLDGCGRPRIGSGQTGRFIIVHPGFLETTDYPAGGKVSAIGRITGIRKGRIGDADFRFPLLESYKVHRWPDQPAVGDYRYPWVNIGIGGGSGNVYGGVGVVFWADP